MEKSVVIIGGGLGGLATGAILAKEGLRVTVIEKNATVGGGLQSFRRFGELFDTGMHVVGGMREGGNIRRICEYLGIVDRLHLVDVDDDTIDRIYFAEDRSSYRIAQGRDMYVRTLAESFPDQEENLRSYVDAMYRVAGEVDLFYLRPSSDTDIKTHSDDFLMPANVFIAKYISDERLRSVVAYMNPFYGGRRNVTPAYIHALISISYIEGPSRFAGGSCLFAETLSDFITGHGGTVRTNERVVRIASSDRHITGVDTNMGNTYSADYYISDIHPCTMVGLLDPPSALPKLYRTRLDSIPNSYSAFTVNLKLKPGSFPYINHSGYYMRKYADIWNFGSRQDNWPLGFLYMTPPELEQGEFAQKMIVSSPMLWDEVRQWEDTSVGHRGQDYAGWKQERADRLLDCMEELYPGFRQCVEAVNTASPLTIRDFYGVKEGAMCGFSKDSGNMILSNVPVYTKIPNLLLTGQNCNLHGFCGVFLTAINTVEAILGQNYIVNKLSGKSCDAGIPNEFDDIRPFYDSEIPDAMRHIADNKSFGDIVSYVFPDACPGEIRKKLLSIDSIRGFQIGIMYPALNKIVDKTMTSFTHGGREYLDRDKNCLFISNHRDIMLDASLMNLILADNGFDTTEITFGANLMQGDIVINIGKSNKMFRVERPGGSIQNFYKSSLHLSRYIRTTLLDKHQSVWIANRNGRTKDGLDRTDQGIVKMLGMSGTDDIVRSISALNILPVAISYELEPCDFLKAMELYATLSGPYHKKDGEDLNSILTGIRQMKGRVHIEFCQPLSVNDLEAYSTLRPNEFHKKVASLIDSRICSAYRLFPNNYIAHDIRSGSEAYASQYTPEQKREFISRMALLDGYASGCNIEKLRGIFLDIYANPVDSKNLFMKADESC